MHQDYSSPQFPEHEHLKCPRCHSNNTKFCYYNNYNLSQPRHFCKNCRRYWTKGGTLRNIPVGGATRKNTKRSSNLIKRPATQQQPQPQPPPPPPPVQAKPEPEPEPSRSFGLSDDQLEIGGGSFGSMLASNHVSPFGNFLIDGLTHDLADGSGVNGLIRNPNAEQLDIGFLRVNNSHSQSGGGGGGGGGKGETSCWNGGENGWPDLSIFTPGSSFH